MTAPLASMADAALAAGVHYDTFRRGWRDLVRDQGFPAPVKATRPYRWRPSSLSDWQARQEAANAAALRAPADPGRPANENHTPAPALRRVDRERGAVLALMQGNFR
ncbi:MAG: hypothetical protein K2X61_09475 [Caulobacteraceae bacterium]|nr:hypothetical protein [Caulobacteraceae bacterium]